MAVHVLCRLDTSSDLLNPPLPGLPESNQMDPHADYVACLELPAETSAQQAIQHEHERHPLVIQEILWATVSQRGQHDQ